MPGVKKSRANASKFMPLLQKKGTLFAKTAKISVSNIQALLPILALDAVARGLHVWRSREKRYSARRRFGE
jgi:hypothetical protein